MVEQIILFVDDRVLAAHQQQALIVTHTANFIRHTQFAARRLQAVAAAAPAAFANALAFGAFGFLAENFGKILVCTVLVTAEVKQGVTVSDYAFPIVFEQAF